VGDEVLNFGRYERQMILPNVGRAGQEKLARAHVLVVGAGGLGSPIALYLAAAGVGVIGLVDDDRVELSNLQRQVLYSEADIGFSKVDVAARRLRSLNSDISVVEHRTRITPENALALLANYDVIVDGTDNYGTRYLLSDACALVGKPHVWGSVFQFEGQVCVWWPAVIGPCYRCVFPSAASAQVPSCTEAGVVGAVCGAIGTTQASAAIALILGAGHTYVGRLRIFDALSGEWASMAPVKREDCPTCGTRTMRVLEDSPDYIGAACDISLTSTLEALSPAELDALLNDPPAGFRLVDVRETVEHDEAAILGDELIPLGLFLLGEASALLNPADDVVLYCHSGIRSMQAAQALPLGTVGRLRYLDGGFLGWAKERRCQADGEHRAISMSSERESKPSRRASES